MSARNATLLTLFMLSAIIFAGAGILAVDAGGHMVSSDGYGISTAVR
ncbi:MAG: hypothetical protein ACRECW_09970 [Phyllobacterium sp.]